jgi:hypothetical protein
LHAICGVDDFFLFYYKAKPLSPLQRSRILYFLDMFLSKDADASLVGRILLINMKKNGTHDSQELIISSEG